MAKIQLNVNKVDIKSSYSIFELLKKYKLLAKRVAIEHNGIIVPKIKYKSKYLKDKDRVEIVHFIGGG